MRSPTRSSKRCIHCKFVREIADEKYVSFLVVDVRRAAAAVAVGAAFAAMVFFGSGRANQNVGAFHDSDFDAFDAAQAIVDEGGDPYAPGAVDAELLRGGERYSDDFVKYPDGQPRLFFNPPLWLSMLRVIGFSSNVLVVGGAFLTGTACAALFRPGAIPLAAVPAVFFLWDRLFLWANAGFGQAGYLVSASMLWSLVALRSGRPKLGGAAAAFLSFKPHIWLAQLVGGSHSGRELPIWQFICSATIGLLSVTHLGWRIWAQYVQSVVGASTETPTNQSLTFTVLAPFMQSRVAVLLAGVLAISAVILVTRTSVIRFEAKWIITVALLMMASTHAFWHDWAWLLAVPLLLNWKMLPAMSFYLAVPLSSVLSNSAPAFIVVGTLGVIVWNETRDVSSGSTDDSMTESEIDRPTVLADGRI